MPKKNVQGEGPWYCTRCGLGLTKVQAQKNDCPRCYENPKRKSWEPRYTLEQAQEIARTLPPDAWQIVRRLAVAELHSRNVEEIGSSDVSCVALEWIERERIKVTAGIICHIDDDIMRTYLEIEERRLSGRLR